MRSHTQLDRAAAESTRAAVCDLAFSSCFLEAVTVKGLGSLVRLVRAGATTMSIGRFSKSMAAGTGLSHGCFPLSRLEILA